MCEVLDYSMIYRGVEFFIGDTVVEILTDRYLDPNGYDVANVLITDKNGSKKLCLELMQITSLISELEHNFVDGPAI